MAGTLSPRVTVETAFTDPYPIEPGDEVDVTFVISNDGSEALSDLVIEVKPNYPFNLLENPVKTVNTINVGSERQVEYKMFVSTSAISSTYKIPVLIKIDNAQLEKTIDLTVQGVPKFNLLNVVTGSVNPGDEESITVGIENIGTGKAKRTTVTFTSTSEMIKPILSGGTEYIDDVEPGGEENVNFRVLVSQDADYGVYTSFVNVSYEDESGTELSKVFEIGVLVGGEPQLQIVKSEIDTKNQELEVEIINIGSAEAIGIKGELYVDDELFDVDYVTQLKIDKKTTLKFKIPKKAEIADLKISYKAPDNEKFTQDENVSWNKVNGNQWMFAVAVVVVLGIIFRKKILGLFRKKKRRK